VSHVVSKMFCASTKYPFSCIRVSPICRRGEQTDTVGRLKLEPMCPGGSGGGGDEEHIHTVTQGLPRFGALVRR
jgi:hypothetical protein